MAVEAQREVSAARMGVGRGADSVDRPGKQNVGMAGAIEHSVAVQHTELPQVAFQPVEDIADYNEELQVTDVEEQVKRRPLHRLLLLLPVGHSTAAIVCATEPVAPLPSSAAVELFPQKQQHHHSHSWSSLLELDFGQAAVGEQPAHQGQCKGKVWENLESENGQRI